MDQLKILIATGSRAKHKIICGQLKNLPHVATHVRTGDEALRRAQVEHFHVVILQAQLNMVSGLEVCKRLADFEGTKDLPVILFSSDNSLQTRATNAGARAFIKVPFCNIQLITLIRKLLTKVRTVLQVDGDKVSHECVSSLLENAPYDLVQTTNPLAVWNLMEHKRPDVILMDLSMAGIRGDELCTKIKADPGLCGIPIIISSVDGGDAALNVSFRAGADDYIVKPFKKDVLLEKLEKACRRKRRRNSDSILVVEDAPAVRNLMIQGLSQAGFSVSSANNGREALTVLESAKVDLILTDLDMPLMNGRELTREIRKSDTYGATPILMLSADQEDVSTLREKSIGVDEFIRKPFAMDKLVVLVETMLSEHRLKQEQAAIRRYLSDAALAHVKDNYHQSVDGMRAESRFMTVFFADILGFTPMCETMNPHDVVSLLNGYFDTLVQVLRNNEAMIDKFIGDAIMALFGRVENGAYRAVRSGLQIIDAVAEFNKNTGRDLKLRIGINSGNLIMGDIGSKLYRRDYTVIGDTVNVAQRLEQYAEPNCVIIGEMTRQLLEDVVQVEALDPAKLKGREELVQCYRVISLTPIDIA